MPDRFTYKQKLKGLGIIALLALILCWQLAISKTVREYGLYRQSFESGGGDPNEQSVTALQTLRNREAAVMAVYNRFRLDTLDTEKNLLSIAGNFCKTNDLRLKEYRPFAESRYDSIPVLTRVVTVEGRFIQCLKFLFELEKVKSAGRVSAVEFRSYKDTRDKVQRLECTIYIQNLLTN
jgi:hypothetical protein